MAKRSEIILPLLISLLTSIAPSASSQANDAIPKPYSLGFPPNLGLGDEAVAACFAKRKNPQRENALDVFWSKGDRLLTTGTRVSQVKTSASSVTLSIRDIQAEDVANYTCTVRDTEGAQSITVPLIVSGCARVMGWIPV